MAAMLAVFFLALPCVKRIRSDAMGHYLSTRRYEDVYYLPPPGWLGVFSLGYREALADFIWMKALIYFGDELYHRGQVKNLYNYTDAMLTLDEHFKAVYRWVASCALYRTGDITVEDARKAISYLERGNRLFPNDGQLAWDLGATYRFELVPMLEDEGERDRARRRGIEYLRAADMLGAGPSWLSLMIASQLEKLGRTEQAIRHLEDRYSTTYDPQKREKIAARIARLRDRAYWEAFKHAQDEFEQAHRRDFPYLTDTLYWMVGPRPPIDGLGQLRRNFDPVVDHIKENSANE